MALIAILCKTGPPTVTMKTNPIEPIAPASLLLAAAAHADLQVYERIHVP